MKPYEAAKYSVIIAYCHQKYGFFEHLYSSGTTVSKRFVIYLDLANEFAGFRHLFAKFVQKNKITSFRNKIDFPEKEI